jgi:dipeptidyl-peptidase 4
MTELSFPRQNAITRHFTLGAPRDFTISRDGRRVLFLRSRAGDDPVTCLWSLDVGTGQERLLVDPHTLIDGEEQLPAVELARRERVREQAGGVVAYATDREVATIAFALSGRMFVADAASGQARELEVPGPVLDPRPDPSGRRVAYVAGDTLRSVELASGEVTTLAEPDGPEVSWGLAEFVAAEEMGRAKGYWWSPEGDALLAARVDVAAMQHIYIADPAQPDHRPREVVYPSAGTPNAEVSLWLVTLDGNRTEVAWDRHAFEYVVTAVWSSAALQIVVQNRHQRRMQLLEVDPATGATTLRREDTDPLYLDIVPGVPALTDSGQLVWAGFAQDTRRLLIGDREVTRVGLQLREVLGVDGETVLFTASSEPSEIGLWTAGPEGARAVEDRPGLHTGRCAGATTVVSSRSLEHDGVQVTVRRGGETVATIASHAQIPVITPQPAIHRFGSQELRTAVLLPSDHVTGSGPLPVLLDPYGGPAAQRVLVSRGQYLTSQWFADQGFAVVVIDGRGTPARGYAWERSVCGDYATPVLEDQVEGLQEAARAYPDLDLGRVAIRGWSFGGYLAALAVLRRPDVFHAAVSGAPDAEPILYDSHYRERYLGLPAEEPENYARCSLIPDAPKLTRPLLLIHGLADDNVLVAHGLRLSAALTTAGRPHSFLPLVNVTHMTPQPDVAENRLLLELEFLRRSLGIDPAPHAHA